MDLARAAYEGQKRIKHMALLTAEFPEMRVRLAVGALSGLIGGVLMSMFEMLYHTFGTGLGPLIPPNMIAKLFGYSMQSNFGIYTLVGMSMHLLFSAFLGLLWGLAFPKTPTITMAAILGILYGFILYWIMFYLVTPVINPDFATMGRTIPMVIGHLFFGLGFAFYPRLVEVFRPRLSR